jgi:hypothetical protein
MPEQLAVYSPEWWLARLVGRLATRSSEFAEYDRFHQGDQPLAFASEKFREIFGRRYGRLPANFMPLVVDAEAERLIVQGFRFGNATDGDRGVWKIWQENQLDAESQIAHEIALIKGVAYALVAPPIGESKQPVITIEDPAETIVETAPGNRRTRLAALKVYTDDDDYARAYLYLPDAVYRWRSKEKRKDNTQTNLDQVRWEPFLGDDGTEDWPTPNPIGVVPVIPLLNQPRRSGAGRSEIAPVMGNQNAINKLRFDALVASEYVAFPQRWATNIDVPIDEQTGQAKAPFKPGVDVLWTVRRPTPEEVAEYGDNIPVPQLGQFPTGDLKPYFDAIDAEMGQMSSISRTPYYYFLSSPTSVPPSGESLKSSEARLVKKVGRQAVHFGEGWEEVMRVALIAADQRAKARTDAETIWADPETRNEAARTDALLKQHAAGLLPDEFVLGELGYSVQQIERIRLLKASPTSQRVDAATALVRGGYDPAAALEAVGLDPVKHLGLIPVTVQAPASATVPSSPAGPPPAVG